MFIVVRTSNRSDTSRRDGQMVLCWTADGVLDVERSVTATA
jgi:hypothetical protein